MKNSAMGQSASADGITIAKNAKSIPTSSPSSPHGLPLTVEDNHIRIAQSFFRSPPATAAKLFVGPGIATGVALNFFALFAVFNVLNFLDLDKVKQPGRADQYTKDSATWGGAAGLVNNIMGFTWDEFVAHPYGNSINKVFGRNIKEDDFEKIKREYVDFKNTNRIENLGSLRDDHDLRLLHTEAITYARSQQQNQNTLGA